MEHGVEDLCDLQGVNGHLHVCVHARHDRRVANDRADAAVLLGVDDDPAILGGHHFRHSHHAVDYILVANGHVGCDFLGGCGLIAAAFRRCWGFLCGGAAHVDGVELRRQGLAVHDHGAVRAGELVDAHLAGVHMEHGKQVRGGLGQIDLHLHVLVDAGSHLRVADGRPEAFVCVRVDDDPAILGGYDFRHDHDAVLDDLILDGDAGGHVALCAHNRRQRGQQKERQCQCQGFACA